MYTLRNTALIWFEVEGNEPTAQETSKLGRDTQGPINQ